MHDAYEETSILNITVQIESMAAYGKTLAGHAMGLSGIPVNSIYQ